jgi:hypothetical protein
VCAALAVAAGCGPSGRHPDARRGPSAASPPPVTQPPAAHSALEAALVQKMDDVRASLPMLHTKEARHDVREFHDRLTAWYDGQALVSIHEEIERNGRPMTDAWFFFDDGRLFAAQRRDFRYGDPGDPPGRQVDTRTYFDPGGRLVTAEGALDGRPIPLGPMQQHLGASITVQMARGALGDFGEKPRF